MLVLFVILLSMLQMFAKCDLGFKDPIFPPHFPLTYPEDIPFRLGSMTPYHPPQKTCSPLKALCVVRHGAKFPKSDVITKIAALEEYKTYFNLHYSTNKNAFNALPNESKVVIGKIMKWKNRTYSPKGKEINEHGLQTMRNLGQRWNSRLSKIVENIESEEEIEFNSAEEDRCKSSGEEFLNGFLKNKTFLEKIHPEVPITDDYRIKLNKDKPKVQKSEVIKPEEMENIYYNIVCPNKTCYLLPKIINLLFPKGHELEHSKQLRDKITSATVKAMYMACANSYVYVYTQEEEGQAWCYLFDNYDIAMFEDMHDYQYYIKNGYIDTKTMNYGHPIMKDIMAFLQETETKKFKLFAAHTSNCLSLITGFRLFRDYDKLSLENMTEGNRMRNRKWRTSLIGNYTCNIMVVVYNCKEEAISEITEKVSIFLNETPLEVVLENEKSCTLCPINNVIRLIDKLLNDKSTEVESTDRSDNQQSN